MERAIGERERSGERSPKNWWSVEWHFSPLLSHALTGTLTAITIRPKNRDQVVSSYLSNEHECGMLLLKIPFVKPGGLEGRRLIVD
jgi:hypothetical protein